MSQQDTHIRDNINKLEKVNEDIRSQFEYKHPYINQIYGIYQVPVKEIDKPRDMEENKAFRIESKWFLTVMDYAPLNSLAKLTR